MFFEKRKRKLKNDELWYGRRPHAVSKTIMTLLIGILIPIAVLIIQDLRTPRMGVNLVVAATNAAKRLTDYRMAKQFIYIDNSKQLRGATSISGNCEDVVVAPDRTTKAFVCDQHLYLQRGDAVTTLAESAQISLPAFNRDATAIHFMMNTDNNPALMRVGITPEITVPVVLAYVNSVVPPVAHPSTGWLLVAEPDGTNTKLSTTSDTPCFDRQACTKMLALIPGDVSAADFLPNGTMLFYISENTVYSMTTSDGKSTSLIGIAHPKHLAFNRTGTQVAILSYRGILTVYNTTNLRHASNTPISDALAFAWVD